MGTLSDSRTIRRPTRVRVGVLIFACSMALLTYLDRISIMRARPDIQKDLGFSDNDMGLIFAAFSLGYLLFEVPGGWIGDRWGSRRVITRIVLCWSLFTALTGCVWAFSLDSGYHLTLGGTAIPLVLNSLVTLLLIRFLFGVGEAGAFPNVTRVVRVWFPFDERASALGWIWTCARLGGASASVLLGWLALVLGWRQAFWVLGVVGVGWSVLFYSWFRDTPEEKAGCNDAERDLIHGIPSATEERDVVSANEVNTAIQTAPNITGVSTAPRERNPVLDPTAAPRALSVDSGHAAPPWQILFFSPTAWALCVASFFVCFGWYFYATWQPKFWEDVYGISSRDSELLTGAPFLCGGVGTLLGGWWSDRLVRRRGNQRWGRSLLGVGGFTAAGLCVLGAGFTTTVWQTETLLCLGFLVNDLAIPVIWAVCADVGGRYAGSVSGLMNMAGGIGSVLSPALLPRVFERLHPHHSNVMCWRIILVGLAVSWFFGALAWVFIDASKPLFSGEFRAPSS